MRSFRRLTAVILALMLQISCLAAGILELDADNIARDTRHLCETIGIRPAGTDAERAAADWIEDSLRAMGYSEESGDLQRSEFALPDGQVSQNIRIALNPDPQLPLFSVVAHYDSVSTTPGARDNAASVAILLEMARYLSECGPIPGCELHLVFLGSEENGYHGAQAYVSSLTEAERARHAGAFNMDLSVAAPGEGAQLVLNILGGRDERGEVVDAVYLPKMENGVTRAVNLACEELYGQPTGGAFYHGESDHVPFQNAGLEAANVCWRSIEDGRPVLPACYHGMDDTAENLDWDSAVMVGRCILRAIEEMAGAR